MGVVMQTSYAQVFQFIQDSPGCTGRQIMDSLPECNHIYAKLAYLEKRGFVKKASIDNPDTASNRRYVNGYWSTGIKPEENRVWPKIKSKPRLRGQLEASWSAELIELRQWKAQALARYPELAVSDAVMRARVAAEEYYEQIGDRIRASDARSGRLDKSPVIQIAIKAREAAV